MASRKPGKTAGRHSKPGEEGRREKRGGGWLLWILGLFFAGVFLFSAYKLVTTLVREKNEQGAFDRLAAMVDGFEEEEPETSGKSDGQPTEGERETDGKTAPAEEDRVEEKKILSKYQRLYEENPDLFAWISIKGTEVNYPVMFTPENSEYYLRRGFDGKYAYSGTPFLDGRCDPDGKYYLVYGHHMKNRTMFGTLPKYEKKAYCEEHPLIGFDTLYEKRTYQVMAAFKTRIYEKDADVFKYYVYLDLPDEETFAEYVREVKKLTPYDTGVDAEFGDELLVLSTCSYHTDEGRFVVVAKRIE